jgi:hypothetical protein
MNGLQVKLLEQVGLGQPVRNEQRRLEQYLD